MWPFSLIRRNRTDLARMQYSGLGGSQGYGEGWRSFGMLGGLLPGTDIDWWREVRDPTANATVHACLRWIVDNIIEPEPAVFRRMGKKAESLPHHDVIDLLECPNPEYDGDAMIAACAVDYATVGDAYILKERNNRGQVTELWWKPYHEMMPCWPQDGSSFITHYLYRPGGRGVGIRYEKADVIHIRWGLDSGTEGRVGKHRTFPILREIAALNEMSTYTAAMSKMGVPAFAATPKDANVTLPPETGDVFRKWWQALTTRDNRGKPILASHPMDFNKLGLNPNEMALDKLPHRPSLLVCAAFGVHPAVCYLATDPKGLDNGGQQQQAQKQSYHDCLVPMLKRFGKTLTHSLLPDFEKGPIRTSRLYVGFDFEGVQALSEDANQRNLRSREDYKVGGLDRAEFRTETGREPREEDKGVYFAGPEKDQADHELAQDAADADAERAANAADESADEGEGD